MQLTLLLKRDLGKIWTLLTGVVIEHFRHIEIVYSKQNDLVDKQHENEKLIIHKIVSEHENIHVDSVKIVVDRINTANWHEINLVIIDIIISFVEIDIADYELEQIVVDRINVVVRVTIVVDKQHVIELKLETEQVKLIKKLIEDRRCWKRNALVDKQHELKLTI